MNEKIKIPYIKPDDLEYHINTQEVVIIDSDIFQGFKTDGKLDSRTLAEKSCQRKNLYIISRNNLPQYFLVTDISMKRALSLLSENLPDRRYKLHQWEEQVILNKHVSYSRLSTGILDNGLSEYKRKMPTIWRVIVDPIRYVPSEITFYIALQLFENCKKELSVTVLTDNRQKINRVESNLQEYIEYYQKKHKTKNDINIMGSRVFVDKIK